VQIVPALAVGPSFHPRGSTRAAVIAPYPFAQLPRVSRTELGFVNALARWLAVEGLRGGRAVEALVGGPVTIVDGRAGSRLDDRHAGSCELRVGQVAFEIRTAGTSVRAIAGRVLGGPVELAAPRPLGQVEQAIWALAVAAAALDLGIAGEVWPCEEPPEIADAREVVLTLVVGGAPMTIAIRAPRALELQVPARSARRPAWPATVMLDVPIVLGRCAIATAALGRLAIRSVVTLEPARGADRAPAIGAGPLGAGLGELVVLGGAVGVTITSDAAGQVVAAVATGYVPRSMALPDDAHVELTVGLGTTQLSLRQVFELAVGQVVPLGRPLAGPFEIRAAGKLVGRGELVDVDGELGVRVVSLEE
jgi:type III secretion protein Q